jgi:hypothetical protein
LAKSDGSSNTTQQHCCTGSFLRAAFIAVRVHHFQQCLFGLDDSKKLVWTKVIFDRKLDGLVIAVVIAPSLINGYELYSTHAQLQKDAAKICSRTLAKIQWVKVFAKLSEEYRY